MIAPCRTELRREPPHASVLAGTLSLGKLTLSRRIPVTVCIGAICDHTSSDASIVLCADTRVGVPAYGSSDAGSKFVSVRPGVHAAIAGTVARAHELIDRYRQFLGDAPIDRITALDRFRYPAYMQKTILVDEYFRRTWSVTRAEYLNGILSHLPLANQDHIARTIQDIGLEASLIIATFIEGHPRLFTVSENGVVAEDHGFTTIGSGATIAYSALCQRQYDQWFSLPQALYAVYEAKRLSQSEPSVGPKTQMYVMSSDGGGYPASEKALADLDKYFKRLGPKKISDNLRLPGSTMPSSKRMSSESSHT